MTYLERKSPLDLVKIASQESSHIKDVSRLLQGYPPSQEATHWLVHAYEVGETPPWLAAHLLGQIGFEGGYDTAKSILLSGPGQLAESYAGAAMAQLDEKRALVDLSEICLSGESRRIREGAISGLGKIRTKEAKNAVLNALEVNAIFASTVSNVLASMGLTEAELQELLASPETSHRKVGLLMLEARALREQGSFSLSVDTATLASRALTTAMVPARTRRILSDLLKE